MKNKIIIIAFLAVIFIHSYFYNIEKNEDMISINEDILYESLDEKENSKTVNLLYKEDIINIDLEDYVIGVVACEMPASFEVEALKAMAVVARTFALYKMNGNKEYDLTSTISDQCYIDEVEMRDKWDDSFEKYHNKIKDAVNSTEGEYLTYDDEIIKSFYFSISNGKTEDVSLVFGEKLDYLVSVDSSWDENYSFKEDSVVLSTDLFFDKLGMSDRKIETITIDKTNSGRVNTITVNNKEFKGTEFRNKLDLKSTDFEISYGKLVTIKTKGYGHGVGMSQYGAEGMAKNGKSYEEILKHYYTGVELMYN